MTNSSLQPSPSTFKGPSLINIVAWSQKLACEVLQQGDLAVDLTAGKGRDTYALAKAVGLTGQVVAFDLQSAAIEETTRFLQTKNHAVKHWPADQLLTRQIGVFLVRACHATLNNVLQNPVQVVMANLGYLPGGDQTLITRPESTLEAFRQSVGLLNRGGRLVVTVYPSHPGGAAESEAVNCFFSHLPTHQWQVLLLRAANHDEAPYLFAAQRL